MRLFIAEKPSLGRAIAAGLGVAKTHGREYIECCGGDIVTWCFGHILEQFGPEDYNAKYAKWNLADLPFIPEYWQYKPAKDCKEQLAVIKKLIGQASIIVNAGDPDREGQLLVDEVLHYLNVPASMPVQRILVNALDEKSVQEALGNLRDNREFVGFCQSALARSRADWIIGMNMTRAATLQAEAAGFSGVTSVGRVQTPTLALVVRREEEIQKFKPVNFYLMKVNWLHEHGVLPSIWQPAEGTEGLDADGHLLKKDVADALLAKIQGQPGHIRSVEQKQGQAPQPLPYSLSALQIAAGRKFGYSPQQVLDTQQSLYEKKLTTYPRSDCDYLPTNQLADVPAILGNLASLSPEFENFVGQADQNLQSRAWNDKKISAHHAIIPTTVKARLAELTEAEQNLYRMVSTAYLAQFFPPQKFLATKIEIEAAGETFKASGKVVLSEGWKVLYKSEPETDGDTEADGNRQLPAVREQDAVTFKDGMAQAKETKPPQRFTEATLIAAMKNITKYLQDQSLAPILKECSGIGTEATRASELEKIKKRSYVRIEKKHLVPTEKGKMVIKTLPDSITYPDITARWEADLDDISRREMHWQEFSDKQQGYIKQLLDDVMAKQIEAPKDIPKCPKCGRPLKQIYSKKQQKHYWVCSAGREICDAIFDDKHGKPELHPTQKKKKATGYKPGFNRKAG